MPRFILNDKLVDTSLPSGSTVLDFVRYHKRLTGTKIGCREGDCGACTVLVGDIENEQLVYRSMTSCLMPLGNAEGKHIVTVEGINMPQLSPVQQALVDTNGTQCGFCTIGFVMSLTGFVLHPEKKSTEEGIAAIDGNICRCTGYKSIERAVQLLSGKLSEKPVTDNMGWLVQQGFLPGYFAGIEERLKQLQHELVSVEEIIQFPVNKIFIGGGTDLVVQKSLTVKKSATQHLFDELHLKEISLDGNTCRIGASVTVSDIAESPIMQHIFPELSRYIKLISSTPIRNMATIAGNLVNASPIGDMTVFLLALDASLVLSDGKNKRSLLLKNFYKGYKQLDKQPEEFIEAVYFTIPTAAAQFNFEKVCKRTHLDIASVNAACLLETGMDGTISGIHLSAGGVAPYPKYLQQTASYLTGKKMSAAVMKEAIRVMQSEVAPISDARGTEAYKRLLLRQLFLAHFMNQPHLVVETLNEYD